jgi:hypothetical protein
MRNLLAGGLVLFAGVVSPVSVAPCKAPRAITPDYRKDPRFEALRGFFARFDCPAQYFSHHFLAAADRNSLDWRLLPSISWVESTGGKAAVNNNMFGWDSGRAHFASPAAGIDEVGYQLGNATQYRDKTLDALLATYNPDAGYAAKVKAVMRRIAPVE